MMTAVKATNRFFLLALAPFLGLLLGTLLYQGETRLDLQASLYAPPAGPEQELHTVQHSLDQARQDAETTIESIAASVKLYQETTETMNAVVYTAAAQASRPQTIYNRRITAKVGFPYEVINSDRITLELYKINPGSYKGNAMKIRLKDPSAMKMTLAGGQMGVSETTMQAVLRNGAVAGINAGGFADKDGKRYPLSTTVVGGQYLTGFESTYKDLSFVGMNTQGKLIGGKFTKREQLDALQPAFGATFVPVLLKNGQKVPIPEKWKNSPKRAPRTVIGKYKDDQIVIIVADGYNENGSSGATLEEMQHKLYQMGVVDAYNLDGGGSSSLIVNGKVVNHPSDGRLRPVPTHFLFFK